VIVDADRIAHRILAPGGAAVGAVVERFGPEIASSDGGIDRPRLRTIVFADPAARRDLEAITHPLIYAEMVSVLGGSFEPDTVVVVDAPLLVETGGRDRMGMQALVVVAAEQSQQIERVLSRGGMSAQEAASVIAAQAPAERKLAAADYVLDNRASLQDLEAGVETLWGELLERFGSTAASQDPAGRAG
jgi:dephospho-CoA kinase